MAGRQPSITRQMEYKQVVEIALAVAAAHSEYAARKDGRLVPLSWGEGVGLCSAILALVLLAVCVSVRG